MPEPTWPTLLDMKLPPPEYPQDPESCSPPGTITDIPQGRWRRHFSVKVSNRNTDHVLLLCWFTTGLLDSTIFNAYRTFVSMQTGKRRPLHDPPPLCVTSRLTLCPKGNTMFLGLGASNYDTTTRPYAWTKSLVSLICFVLGALFFSRLGARFQSSSQRSVLTISFLIQASIILLCALLVQANVVEGRLEYIGEDIDWVHTIPIALLSFQAPGQVWLSRDLNFAEVSTVVVSTMLYDFGSDLALFDKRNAKRNRRFAGFCALLVGAVAGGWVTKLDGHITIPMWIAGALKMGIAGAWAVWPAEERVRRWGG
ncbi:MAG: hypothetical protein L6R39_002636 [Caloplaca ligustica]|nr:MAG: hypothetical protein L6R39_002636 [Caloplaca ligustica]